MGRYTAKQISESIWYITHNRKKVGHITTRVGNKKEWIAKMYNHVGYGTTPNAAFNNVVAISNRIQLCGENNPVKARAALAERNAKVEEANTRQQKMLERIALEAGLPLLRYHRPRRSRILI